MKTYFIHIRKTAGTAMREQIKFNVETDKICPELSEFELFAKHKEADITSYLSQFDFYSGHYYTLPKYLDENVFIFTILREPIARCISDINQIYGDEKDLLHKYVINKKIIDILDDEKVKNVIENTQTKQLVSNAGYEYNKLNDQERIDIAKSYLDSIGFFGLQEQFQTSIYLLAKMLDWKIPNEIKVLNTKTTEKGMKTHHNIHFMSKIYNLNKLDIQVYNYAAKKFDMLVVSKLKEMNGY
ncbi:MAG TPA: hypothetical protein ENK66_04585 [Arcobacter sp.]|nr:hypothetical protein [Arcobacter sp.]